MKISGVVFSIEPDRRDPDKALVRIQLQGCLTRPAVPMSMIQAGFFRIGEPVTLTLDSVG